MRRTAEKGPGFESHAHSYSEAVERSIRFAGAGHDLYTRIKAEALLELADRFLGDPSRAETLDVGCGPGETDRFLKGRFARLMGVDTSPAMVAAASRRNPWASYASYGAEDLLPFEEGRFDLVFSICVLHHVPTPDWDRFAAELSRVVRPGGVVAVFEHNPWNPLTRKAVRDCEFDIDVTLASRRRLKRLLSRQGLEVVAAPHIIFFPREGAALRRLERRLTRLPLGAQHYVAARKASERP